MKHLMKLTAVALALAAFTVEPSTALAQGGLTPPGAPNPTMKSLDQIEPRTAIAALPFVITNSGAYYLAGNLTGVAGSDGITINASDVTVDLNGFSLTGVPASKNGININQPRATILNGAIHHWGINGVSAFGALNTIIKSVVVSSNGAIGLDAGVHGLVESCVAEANVTHGIYVANGTTVRNCFANRNGQSGIYCYNTGSFSFGSLITGCTASQNGTGIAAGPNALVTGNILMNNSFAGVGMAAQGARIENNHFAYNYNGVNTPGLTNLVIRNSFIGSSNAVILNFAPGLPIGPVITAAGVATNTNPNANFAF